jgi:sigma-B regulation protein RsbU (phosphoserine phosphatase)
MLHGAFRSAVHSTRHPCELLWRAHELLVNLGERAGGPRLFSASVFVGVLMADGRLTWANAGHPSPFVLRRGRAAIGLDPTAPPVGLVAPESCEERTERLVAGDRLFLYTDGILPDGAVPDDLRAEVDRLGGASADDIVQRLIGDGIDDDRTAVLVTYKGRR